MLIKETDNLITIANYAKKKDWSTSYIYRLIKNGKLEAIEIDGVKFIDTSKVNE